jgi:leucyl-tRNA synthetase
MERYEPKQIEAKWRDVWEREQAFAVPNPKSGEAAEERHWYQLEMLPYPSGTLHMGHVLNYTMGDVVTHFRRRHGWRVLRPMGFDSFGLPAENAAITEGGHPREITERNIAAIRVQMKRLGWVIDWDREVSAHEVEYYRWTQWLFLKFFERGLAYRAAAPVNWCPNDQTVVANEHVVDGRCWRCGYLVEARNMEQWFFRITAYADELLEYDLPEGGEWPERTKTIQRNWIGRSEGAEVLFRIDELDADVSVFTTRPDTLFGSTFFVLAPEHPLVERIANDEVRDYAKRTAARRGEDREAEEVKTGVFTGHYATNPVNDERLPVYVADYVLMEYGTGAIMGVPAHDERDYQFAQAFDLPIRTVVAPSDGEPPEAGAFSEHTEDEVLVNSGDFTGLPSPEAKTAIVAWLNERGRGAPAVSYRLRDWSFSRQRYWGAPIPIVHCDDCGLVPVPEEDLPVLLPEVEDYRPKGVPPLASKRRSTAGLSTTGVRSRNTSAASTTRRGTCCIRASSSES